VWGRELARRSHRQPVVYDNGAASNPMEGKIKHFARNLAAIKNLLTPEDFFVLDLLFSVFIK
jgi:hypothetical protein